MMNAIDERDEIGEIVKKNTIPLSVASGRDSFLPVESMKSATACPRLAAKYPVLDLVAVMSLPHRTQAVQGQSFKTPRFAIYDAFGSGECPISFRMWDEVTHCKARFPRVWPKDSADRYIKNAVQRRTPGTLGDTITLRANFAGFIPSQTRQMIRSLRPRIWNRRGFSKICLVQEVEEWNVAVVKADPLVVGIKNGVAYLVDRFDTTTFEEYVAREFSQDTV